MVRLPVSVVVAVAECDAAADGDRVSVFVRVQWCVLERLTVKDGVGAGVREREAVGLADGEPGLAEPV